MPTNSPSNWAEPYWPPSWLVGTAAQGYMHKHGLLAALGNWPLADVKYGPSLWCNTHRSPVLQRLETVISIWFAAIPTFAVYTPYFHGSSLHLLPVFLDEFCFWLVQERAKGPTQSLRENLQQKASSKAVMSNIHAFLYTLITQCV